MALMTQARLAVTLRGVKKSFPLGNGRALEALNVEQWALPAGRCTVLTGPSGSGKTTLLNLIAGVSVPTAGAILVPHTDVLPLPHARRGRFPAQRNRQVVPTFNFALAFCCVPTVI